MKQKKRRERTDINQHQQREVRSRLLLDDTEINATSPKRFPENAILRNQARQLRITLDTVMRAQLFELHETFLSN